MTASPTIAVVIPSYHRLERVAPLVDAYLDQGADEVVVVLDGPHPGWRDAVGERVDDERVTVRELATNRGLALARIEGLDATTAEVVLAVDDDVEPGDGFVQRHRAFHAASGADRVLLGYMPVALPPRRGRDDAPTYLYARDYEVQAGVWRRSDSATILGSLWGGTVSLPRALYLRAEAVKPSVRIEYNEDLDLGLRLLELGAEAVFDESARAAHHHARGLAGYMRECTARGQAISDLEDRWGTRPAQLAPLVVIPASYNPVLGRVQRSIARRDRGGIAQGLAVATYRVAGVLHVWKLQDGVARLLRRALAMRGYRLARP